MSAYFAILFQVIFIFRGVLSEGSAQISKNANQFDVSELIKSGIKLSETSPTQVTIIPANGIIIAGSAYKQFIHFLKSFL